jgi:branched-chain amino acid transport system substrate-binding protein
VSDVEAIEWRMGYGQRAATIRTRRSGVAVNERRGTMQWYLAILIGLTVAVGGGLGAAVPAWASHEIVIGLQCDRTGATQVVGVNLCPGYHDYVKLVNARGGVDGHRIKAVEIDHEYKVPQGVEAYERHKKDGAVVISLYGTPHTYALTQKLTEDRIPGTSPGFGRGDSADGTRYPYIFPIAASYWSQATAAVKLAKDQLGGLKGKKIAFLFYDNPAGREPIPVFEELAAREGFQLKTFAVPPPGVEMGAQVLDVAQRYRADFVIAHLFGRSPSVSIKELKRAGYPLRKVVSFVWGAAEADIEAAGGFAVADGYFAMQYAGVGQDFPVLNEIREIYKKEGKEPTKEMASTVYYNRGVLWAAVAIEAIRNALKAKPDGKITGEDVKKGFEQIKGFTLGGLVPPLEITPQDHEGGGWVQVYQVRGGRFVKATDWYKAYPDVVAKFVKEAAKK